MNRIILAVVLIAFAGPAMAVDPGDMLVTQRQVDALNDRLKTVEYWVEREKRLDAQAEKARIDCENARGNNWRRGPDVDPCK